MVDAPDNPPLVPVTNARHSEANFRFGSIEGAFAAYESNPRRVRAEHDTRLLQGATLVAYSFGDDYVNLLLDNDVLLEIVLRPTTVDWRLSTGVCQPLPVDGCNTLGNVCHLKWSKSGVQVWDRDAAFRTRLGRRFKMLDAGFVNVHLYFEDMMFLIAFSRVMNTDTQKDFLRWYEDD